MRSPWTSCGPALLLASALLTGCGRYVTAPPGPATATVTLTSAVTEGAILLRVTGPPRVTGPLFEGAPLAARRDLLLYSRQVSESELVVAVFGSVTSGPLFQVDIPDGRLVGGYTATIVQVADPENELQDVSGYSVAVTARGRN